MTPRFDLEQESRQFADHLSHVLNSTICTGIRLTPVVSTYSRQRTVIGYGITKDNQDLTNGIPVTVGKSPAHFHVGLSVHLGPDDITKHLMVTQSVFILAIAEDVGDDRNVLLHYDYEREKKDNYPEAHLQVCATSPAWEEAGHRIDGRDRLLDRLHLPVGGRRYRPTLEDLIEFLVREKLADCHDDTCDEILEESRRSFHEKQLRAAIRRNPQVAIAQLENQGFIVSEGAAGKGGRHRK
jgi:hypothetical protein